MIPDNQPTLPPRPPDPSNPPEPGAWVAPSLEELQARLPQYEVLEILGRGGMGAVYKARQKSLKRLVAIKILPLGMADDEFKFAERFQNEAQTMARMNHPAIVSVYDFGETTDGLLYFVMEFVDGTDVHRMIRASGKLDGEHALAITAHVCDALSYAHKRGVIHRDIKPANILIDQEGHIKVADFGLAKMHDPAQTGGLTRTNVALGTPDYVAPEVLFTGMVADHRADIYAVGVMLYQMLTGEIPRGMFKLPSQKGIGSDERFDAIICKAMEQDRDERYQSALDVRRDLDAILTTPQPKIDGTGIVPVKEPPLVSNAAGTPARAPRRLPGLWLSVTGAAAVLGIAAFFVFGAKSKPDPVPQPANPAREADADPRWTDWLGPILASGKPPVRNWRIVQDGVTTDQPISGANVIDRNVRDAAVRISYDFREGSGIQITMRERSPGGTDREIYFVDDTGPSLYIARKAPGGAITELEPPTNYPPGTPRAGLRTLEFRCVGNRLEATLTGATPAPVTVSVTDATLTAGPCAVVLKKGAILKKVEVLELDRSSGIRVSRAFLHHPTRPGDH